MRLFGYSYLVTAFSAGLVALLFATPLFGDALSIAAITPTPPVFSNPNGERIETVEVGRQLQITTTFTSHVDTELTFVGLVEVRDATDVTVYLAWQSGLIAPHADSTIGVSWAAKEPSDYYYSRAFAISSLENPQILSQVMQSEVKVNLARDNFDVIIVTD